MLVFGAYVLLSLLANPAVVLPSVAVGLICRRWWHLLPGAIFPPAAYWTFYEMQGSTLHFDSLLPFIAAAGTVWSSVTFALKRAWTR